MAHATRLDVQLIGVTGFHPPVGVGYAVQDGPTDAEQIVEFAGRACHETFDRPNPRIRSNAAYLRHILEVGEVSLLEHASATAYIRGISEAAAVDLARERSFAVTQLSRRYMHPEDVSYVAPQVIAEDPGLSAVMDRAVDDARFAYEELLAAATEALAGERNALLKKKKARRAARAVLPQAAETRLVVTGSLRTWRRFIRVNGAAHADPEIRALAVRCLDLLRGVASVLFDDFDVTTLTDGSRAATTPYREG